jgi:Tfp pilus assembly protein PilV
MGMNRLNCKGAILADVLLATLILGMGLLAWTGLFMQVGQAGNFLKHQEQAAVLAFAGMERLRHLGSEEWTAENLWAAAGTERLQLNDVLFDRSTVLRARPDLDPAGRMLEAEVRIQWNEKGRRQNYSLVTYFAVDTELANLR